MENPILASVNLNPSGVQAGGEWHAVAEPTTGESGTDGYGRSVRVSTMSPNPRNRRIAFRPTLGDIRLEERVVMNGAATMIGTMAASVATPPTTGNVQANQTGLGNLTARQIRNAFRQQIGLAQNSLRQFARDQVNAMFSNAANFGANGRPTAQALADFNAGVAGAINATALRLSAQASLLPGASRRVLPVLQNSLLGSGSNSLASRLTSLGNSRRALNSPVAFENAINRQINNSFRTNTVRFNNFLTTTPLNRLSVDPTTGQRIPLSQFMANAAANQINNTFGTLANNVGPLARTVLFDTTGAFSPQAQAAFQQQFANALGTAAFQVGSLVSMFPNGMTALAPQLQSALFATGIDPLTGLPSTSFVNGLANVFPTGTSTTPFTPITFDTGFQNAFTTGFQNFTTPLNTFFGVVPTSGTGGTFQLPNGFFQTGATFPGLLGSQFTGNTFNNGFNNGFLTTGSGFPGFGTAPTGFNTNFGTGFNNFIGGVNTQFGFTPPTFGTGTGTSIGTGTGTGTGTGLPTGGVTLI